MHHLGHVRVNDAGAQLVHHDALRRQTVGIAGGQHHQAGLCHTVLHTVRRRYGGRCRANVDDGSPFRLFFRVPRLLEHLICHQLGHKHGALEHGAHHKIKAFFGGLQHVQPDLGGHACIVDQHVDLAKTLDHSLHKALAICGSTGVALLVQIFRPGSFQLCHVLFVIRTAGIFQIIHVQNRDVIAMLCKLQCNAKPNAAASAGHDCSLSHHSILLFSPGLPGLVHCLVLSDPGPNCVPPVCPAPQCGCRG